MDVSQLVYCQHMLYLSEQQAKEWTRIAEGLASRIDRRLRAAINQAKAEIPHIRAEPPQGAQEPAVPDDPDRARMQRRMAHVIRGVILMIALGMPRTLFYVYGAYSVLVLSGVTDHIQSQEFRRWFSGSRPSLDLQLSRLRQRIESLERLARMEEAALAGSEVDEGELQKERDFIESFKSNKSWTARFAYQLVFMFFYSALPSCNPHAEYLV